MSDSQELRMKQSRREREREREREMRGGRGREREQITNVVWKNVVEKYNDCWSRLLMEGMRKRKNTYVPCFKSHSYLEQIGL
jgi:hypothetical protein